MILFRNCAVLLIIGSICSFFYGVGHLQIEVEPNACRMTYMFGEPMFARVRFTANKQYANYGLYYYYEGFRKPLDPRKERMTGAPVIFVPGNAGSYKQVRSLASVALRKAREHTDGIHLDYYTVDFDEELSAFYGGYMYQQQSFLKHCIRTILSIYKGKASSIVLIGHSMGGKLAQSMLTDPEMSQYINTIISISTPIDQPVLNLDVILNQFYVETQDKLRSTRTATQPTVKTNLCQSQHQKSPSEQSMDSQDLSAVLDNVLLISTGGGNRDLLVSAGLTTSIFNDIHAMTSSIPRVNLSCDHLSAVWCLQFMQVINRFLFSIALLREDRTVVFSSNKQRNLQSALAHFVKPRRRPQGILSIPSHSNWHEERHLVINKFFAKGLKAHHYELIGLEREERFKKVAIEALNVESDDNWLFGCAAKQHNESGHYYCHKATPLMHLVQRVPNAEHTPRSIALLDLHNLRKTYEHWTHVLVRLPPSGQRSGYNLDIYDQTERTLDIRMPRWYSFRPRQAVNETLQGTLHYRLRISELVEPYQALQVFVEPLKCLHENYRVTARVCVPWAAGFERFQTLTAPDPAPGLYVNVPTLMPRQYNTTENPVLLDLYLDPVCRYRISYAYSHTVALSRLVHEFTSWLPAHLVCVLLIVLKHQINKFQPMGSFKSLKPYIGYLQYTSLYVVTGCRLLKKLLLNMPLVPDPEPLDYSINISIIIQSTAIGLSILASFSIWLSLSFYGNAIYRLAQRLTRLSASGSNIMVSIMTHLPITYGILTIGVALCTCSGVGLLLAFIFYFLMLSNAYKDDLEDYFWQKAADLLKRATGSDKPKETYEPATSTTETDSCDDDDEDEDEQQREHTHSHRLKRDADDDKTPKPAEPEPCLGLHNFPFHITLLLLLLMQLLLNVPASLAWLRSRRHGTNLADPAIHSSIVVLASLSLLLQLRAPQKFFGYTFMSIVLYLGAGIVLLYCQAAIFRLNFVIASVFALLAMHQYVCSVWRRFIQSD
ncbi:CG3160 [Drosophila busckii]|uniref:GPI inositol-deacylase n=1 Tax=Drosophila busckii TaxID=30019 RepID=A0A0M4EP13_DROBS|nr:GPI inositol-deacylase [Drosophila busckii]ALC49896.1 CG3160 [Drosophila busckii]